MSILDPKETLRASELHVSENELEVLLMDGRRITIPLVWFPKILHATKEQRNHWEFLGDGEGIHWPDIDEDLSINGLVQGIKAPKLKESSKT
jgi:hypothetical protein